MKSVKTLSTPEQYDTLPYDSYSFAYSHPARLSAVARLFGLTPPENKQFRVLELGSASGGNIIPLAMYYPDVEVVGIDYSSVQVEQGQKLIKSLKLEDRVQLICQSITDIDKDLGQFDYIICHGVYSWVPTEVQDAIITTIQNHLTPNGVAYVSYNVYPGWKRLEIIRDMMLYHTRDMKESKPQERMAQGRAIVEFIRNMSHEKSGIRQMIDAPWEGLKNKADNYLAHEFLESVNQPCYFLDFSEKLTEHKLTYLADAEPHLSFIQGMPEEKIKELIAASRSNQVMLEQYLDFLYFRQFRKSLIVHQSAASSIKRKVGATVFNHLSYSINSCIEKQTTVVNSSNSHETETTAHAGNVSAEQDRRFILNGQQEVTTHNDANYAILKSIAELSTEVFNKDSVLKLANEINDDPQLELHLTNLLNRLSLSGATEIWEQLPPATPTLDIDDKPFMPKIMRDFYKETGYVSNYRHRTIQFNIIQKEIILLLDGEHNQKQLKQHLLEAFTQGKIRLFDKDNQPLAKDKVDASLATHLRQALELFKLNGLLYKK
ncbi:class I SAM-dependent methyltransferase [Oligella ureolytica]